MKKYITIATCWGLFFSLGACSHQGEDFSSSGREIQITAAMETSGSRATAWGFEKNDKIGVFIKQEKNSDLGAFTCTENPSDKWKPTGEPKSWLDEVTPADFVAYYPYQEVGVTYDEYEFSVQNEQNSEELYAQSDLLYSDNVKKLSSVNVVDLRFRHMMSKLIINIKGDENTTSIRSVSLSGTLLKAKVNLGTGEITPLENTSKDITPLSRTKTKEYLASYEAILIPQTLPEGTPLVKIGASTYTYKLSSALTLGSGEQRTLELSLSDYILHASEVQAWEDNFDGDNLRVGIRTPIDLVAFAVAWNNGDEPSLEKYGIKQPNDKWVFKLRANIDMTNVTKFQPIGPSNPFNGTFDGQGFTISNLTYKGDSKNCGFFAWTGSNTTVTNLHLKDIEITNTSADESSTGGMVGLNDGSTFTNCTVTGIIRGANSSKQSSTGGFCGKNTTTDAKFDLCKTETEVYGGSSENSNTGSLCGDNSGEITECVAQGKTQGGTSENPSSYSLTGGLCGMNTGDIKNSSSSGITLGGSAGESYNGGLCGRNKGSLMNCHSKCDVTGGDSKSYCITGGLVGSNNTKNDLDTKSNCSSCSSSGSVQGGNASDDNGGSYTGGLCGDNDTALENCHSKSNVTGGRVFGYNSNTYTGGFVGQQQGNNRQITNCFSEGMVAGNSANGYDCQSITGGLIGFLRSTSLSNCYSSSPVLGGNSLLENGKSYTGGLIGLLNTPFDVSASTSTIDNCYATGIIKGGMATGDVNNNTCDSHTGGLIGYAFKAKVTASYMTNTVYGQKATTQSTTGGLIGCSVETTIEKCYTTGNVSAPLEVPLTSSGTAASIYSGGLAGKSLKATISYCYTQGDIASSSNSSGTSTANYYSGGLIGTTNDESTISYCYASGVQLFDDIQGLIGNSFFSSQKISYCFWNKKNKPATSFSHCYPFDPKNQEVELSDKKDTLLNQLNSGGDNWVQKAGQLPTLK